MANKKYAARGPRQIIDWGTVKKKVAGKTVSVKAYSKVMKSAVDALGLKATETSKLQGATAKKNKKGRLYLAGPSITGSGGRVILCSTGETRKTKSGLYTIYHRVPVPPDISLAKAVAVFSKSKIKIIKFPNGAPIPIGKGGK
jgi:hypothetical protein